MNTYLKKKESEDLEEKESLEYAKQIEEINKYCIAKFGMTHNELKERTIAQMKAERIALYAKTAFFYIISVVAMVVLIRYCIL